MPDALKIAISWGLWIRPGPPGPSRLKASSALPDIPFLALMLRGPNWSLFCPQIRAFTGFVARFLRPFPKSLATVKYNQKQAAGSR